MSYFVQQRTAYDCGVACLAMALIISYENALTLVEREAIDITKGMRDEEVHKIIQGLGIDVTMSEFFFPMKKQIVAVPSLNLTDCYHYVYWDGEKVHDPNYGKENKRHYHGMTENIPFTFGILLCKEESLEHEQYSDKYQASDVVLPSHV